MKKCLENLVGVLEKQNFDAFLVTNQNNIRYLTDFRGNDSVLVVSEKGIFVITDFRYLEEVEFLKEDPLFNIELRTKRFSEALKRICKKLNFKNLAFEARDLRYSSYNELKKALSCNLVPVKALVEDLRLIKAKEEIALIKNAISISKLAYKNLLRFIKPGMSEVFLASKFDFLARNLGAERVAYETIVATMPNSSKPHAEPTLKKVQKDSKILIDFGVNYKGYNSDLTRMVLLGKIDNTFRKIYNIVKTAQKIAIEKIKPGLTIQKLDYFARKYIKDKGFGKFFGHALGHGVGLSVHEDPIINSFNQSKLLEGMVFTIEPGIYISGWGGVRLEEMVLVTEKGCKVLSNGNDQRF